MTFQAVASTRLPCGARRNLVSSLVTVMMVSSMIVPVKAAEPAPRTLSLSQAEETALRHQPTLRQAHGQTEAAEGRVEEARAGYLPQATATAGYQRTTVIIHTGGPRPTYINDYKTVTVTVTAPTLASSVTKTVVVATP